MFKMEKPLTLDEVASLIDTIPSNKWEPDSCRKEKLYAPLNKTTRIRMEETKTAGFFGSKKQYTLEVAVNNSNHWLDVNFWEEGEELVIASFSGRAIEPIYQSIESKVKSAEEAKRQARIDDAIKNIRSNHEY
jgi:hypothetical protein